jgi:hypothetical protein
VVNFFIESWKDSYETIILPVVVYVCETWSLILREEHRLRVFENSVEKNIWTEERGIEERLDKTT